jgi:hypothetical protein
MSTQLLKHVIGWALAVVLAPAWTVHGATRYQAGDVVEDFTLIDRSTRQPVQLTDLAGKIIFLEWFAWWCPFCQAAAPQVHTGIVDWYSSRAGNPDGIPVVQIAINLQQGQESQTANFVNRAEFGLVLEDFDRSLANRFQSGGQPIFAVINGVTNSPSHRPWELLLHQDGYGQRDFSESLSGFRSVIDSVRAAPSIVAPTFVRGPLEVTVEEGSALELTAEVMGTMPLQFQWFLGATPIEGATSATWSHPAAKVSDSGEYRVRVWNAAGAVERTVATVRVEAREIVPPRLGILGWTEARELRVELADLQGRSWRLEQSTDGVHWSETEPASLSGGQGSVEIRVPVKPAGAAFFRIRLGPG